MVERNHDKNPARINVLVLLWHSTIEASISVGGVRRIIEFVKRIPEDMHFWILDNSPTVLNFSSPQYSLFTYTIPSLFSRLLKLNLMLGRFFEWIITSIKLFFEGRKILKEKKCNVIYVPMAGLLFLFLPAFFLKLFYGQAAVADIFDFEVPYGSILNYYRRLRKDGYSFLRSILLPTYIRFQLFLIRILSKKIDCIITISQYQKDFIRKTGAKCPTGFIPGGIDYKLIENISMGPQSSDAVFVGRHTPEKGIFDLLEIWKRIVMIRPNSRLVMIGSCDEETRKILDKKLKDYQLVDYITIKGVLSEYEKIRIIKASKVFIHPGHIEPLVPVITVLEALACGLPVVLYDLPSCKEQPGIYQHPSFALVPLGDYEAVAKKIIDFIDMNESSNHVITQRAREYARRYNWDNISKTEFEAIKKVIHVLKDS